MENIFIETNLKTKDTFYSPVIEELTYRQYKAIKVKNRVKYVLTILNYLIMIIVGITFLYPFLWMLSMSLRTYTEAISFNPGLIVGKLHWNNYIEAWHKAKMGVYVGNSITYAVLVLGLQYFFIVPAAYA